MINLSELTNENTAAILTDIDCPVFISKNTIISDYGSISLEELPAELLESTKEEMNEKEVAIATIDNIKQSALVNGIDISQIEYVLIDEEFLLHISSAEIDLVDEFIVDRVGQIL
ncbi:MAG: hypothetical protein M0R46_12740 [Candidatus Muirbacterium halophilum]|nr:hypothetical protein [Candidatus Muirbacterium halophilum]